jgi:hypothetical protein
MLPWPARHGELLEHTDAQSQNGGSRGDIVVEDRLGEGSRIQNSPGDERTLEKGRVRVVQPVQVLRHMMCSAIWTGDDTDPGRAQAPEVHLPPVKRGSPSR